ncbi:glycosyl transferase [Paenibacillus glycanilyticus]|uniref:Glycosyl transferase n=1 Tax=Paenibacillus glycanilyticus TaxID=126569 RepID=A0ABQ6NRS3_9BACL|nr:glycosyltransferase family 4 protein [Paenibacillus glycanilyticus]GMK46694.1 glycosyl transferase [Paenibacillus glycanilyticus]
MKIAFLIQALQLTGSEKVAYDLIKQMRARGVSCLLLAVYSSSDPIGRGQVLDDMAQIGVEVVELNKDRGVSALQALRTIQTIMDRFDPDVIHSHAGMPNTLAGFRNLLFRNIYTVTTQHSGGDEWTRFKDRILERFSIFGSDKIVCVAEHVAEAYRRKFNQSRNKLVVIENGIDMKQMESSDELAKTRLRNQLGIGSNELILTNVGRIDPVKNQMFLLEVAERLRNREICFRLLLVGNDQDKNYANKLRTKLLQLRLEKEVLLLGSRPDVQSILQISDFFLFPSRFEASPLALLEAICVGVPIVCSDIPANRNMSPFATHSQLLAWDPELWAEQIVHSIGAPHSVASRPMASAVDLRYLSLDRVTDDYLALYKRQG